MQTVTSFDRSHWADSAFSRAYREDSDHFIPERQYLFHVLRSFFQRFVVRGNDPISICDLGCGDGVLTEQLLATGLPINATLVDGSVEMLEAARQRIQNPSGARYLRIGFEELVRDSTELGAFQLVVSGFAIHHVDPPERKRLFRTIWSHLVPGGFFVHVEVGLADNPELNQWYFELWREWIVAHSELLGLGDRFRGVPDQARANTDNKYSPLTEQLNDLQDVGFEDVGCHYRNGVFCIYSGRRPLA